jgi:hypothetical protein
MSNAAQDGTPKSQTPATPAAAPQKKSSAHRLVHVLGAVLVAVVLPAVVMGVLVGTLGVYALIMGLLLGVTGSKVGGTRRMLLIAPAMGVAAGLAAFTAYDWWWAVLVAITGVIAGAGFRFGWFATLLMIPYASAFLFTPAAAARDAVIYGVIFAMATLYGIVVARRFRAPQMVEGPRYSLPITFGVAIVFGLVLGGAAAIGVALGWTEPYWVAEPILILVLYIMLGKRDRIGGKALGTALGVAAAIPVAIIDPPTGILVALGIIAFAAAFTQAKTYWLMYGLYTFSLVVLLAAPSGEVGFEAEERGFQILLGIGLLVVGLFVLHALATWLAKRDPQPELAPMA